MADQHKMARIILLLLRMLQITAHREGNDLKSIDYSSSSDTSSDSDRDELSRRSLYVKGREWQYEGIPIDFPNRRSGDAGAPETTSTTTTTPRIFPPMNRRFRRIYSPDENTSVEEHPYIAALLVNKELWCGAVVLERDRILTAAHCLQLQYNNRFFREYVKMLNVRVGSTNASVGGETLRVTEITFHPNYKPDTLDFNAAVLRLHKNITFGKKESYVEKIDYSRDRSLAVDNNITFLGWGSVLGSGGLGGQVLLQKVDLPIYDLADCQNIYGRDLVTRTNFCAGFITIAKNVCNHDAGGPAVMAGKLMGILSFSSKRCDTPDQPAVFTSLGALAPWLDTVVESRPVDDTTPIDLDEELL